MIRRKIHQPRVVCGRCSILLSRVSKDRHNVERKHTFRALLAHAFIVDDILSPLNTTALGRFGFGPETQSGRPRLRGGEGETAVRARRHVGLVWRHDCSV